MMPLVAVFECDYIYLTRVCTDKLFRYLFSNIFVFSSAGWCESFEFKQIFSFAPTFESITTNRLEFFKIRFRNVQKQQKALDECFERKQRAAAGGDVAEADNHAKGG